MLFHVIGIGIIRRSVLGWWFLILVNGSAPNISVVAWVGWDTGRLHCLFKKHGIDSTEPRGNDFWFSSAESPDRDWHISDFFSPFSFFSLILGFFLQHHDSPFLPRRGVQQTTRKRLFICSSYLILFSCLILQRKSKSQGSGTDCFSQSLTRPSHDKPHTRSERRNFICWMNFIFVTSF